MPYYLLESCCSVLIPAGFSSGSGMLFDADSYPLPSHSSSLPARTSIPINPSRFNPLPRLLPLRTNSRPLIPILHLIPRHLSPCISTPHYHTAHLTPSRRARTLTCSSRVKLIISSGFPSGSTSPLSTCQNWYGLAIQTDDFFHLFRLGDFPGCVGDVGIGEDEHAAADLGYC